MNRRITVAGIALASCSSSPSGKPASIEGLDYQAPGGWTSRDFSSRQRAMIEWTPEGDNDRKESVTVIRSDRPALAKATSTQLQHILEDTQRALPQGKFSSPTVFTTYGGFHGVRIEGSFVPTGKTETYQRIHGVFLAGSSLVTVIYTAREPDRENFDIVIDNFRRGV